MPKHTPPPPAPTRPRSTYERNHQRLTALLGRPLADLRSGVAYRLRAAGFMDLVVEVLPQCPALAHAAASATHTGSAPAHPGD